MSKKNAEKVEVPRPRMICDLCGREVVSPKTDRQRDIVRSVEDRLNSPHLERLAASLVARWEKSGMTKPDFAQSLGMSGSQFRDLRRRKANPTIEGLTKIGENLQTPLFELMEDKELGDRNNLSAKEMAERFGAIVKQKYESSERKKEEFAEHIGVSVSQLYLIMRGKANPSFLKAVDIAKRMDIGVWVALGVEPMVSPR